jgi:DNA-3-methyladenine glycosylase II
MRQAAGLQRSLSEALGARIDGDFAPPSPERLAEAGAVPGLGPEQVERLRALGGAAAEGRLDAERLRSLPQEQAVAELRALPGVGPWTAEHVVLRGAAPPDGLPTAEPRVERAVGDLYGLGDAPGQPAVREVTEPWRPFRMWVSILAVRRLAALGRFSGVSSDRQRRGRRSGAASRQGSSATK